MLMIRVCWCGASWHGVMRSWRLVSCALLIMLSTVTERRTGLKAAHSACHLKRRLPSHKSEELLRCGVWSTDRRS